MGHYPAAILDMPGAGTEVIQDGDLALISAPLDYYGISYAHPTVVAAAPGNTAIPFSLEPGTGMPMSPAGWPIHPESLTRLLLEMDRRYPTLPPVYVTGSGGAFDDESAAAGTAPDLHRIAYLDGHLAAIAAAIARGLRRPGVFPLVAARQLGVGRGFHPPIRPGAGRPGKSRAHPESLLRALPGSHRGHSPRRGRQPPDRF